MPRTHGYSLIGKRCFGTHNWQARERTNAIGALVGKLLRTVGLFNTNVNAARLWQHAPRAAPPTLFYTWVVKDLLPKLTGGAVIVMDNATFHKRADIQKTIRDAGHTLEFLPAYSPDLNPIERKWAQAKQRRRKLQCSIDQLFKIESFYAG